MMKINLEGKDYGQGDLSCILRDSKIIQRKYRDAVRMTPRINVSGRIYGYLVETNDDKYIDFLKSSQGSLVIKS